MRIHGLCRVLRKMDILQEVLASVHKRSLSAYSQIDREDDFCQTAEAPDIHPKTQHKPDMKTPDFSKVRVTDLFQRLGPLSVFSARNQWCPQRRIRLVRSNSGLGLTLRGDSPVLVAGVVPGGSASVRPHPLLKHFAPPTKSQTADLFCHAPSIPTSETDYPLSPSPFNSPSTLLIDDKPMNINEQSDEHWKGSS
ncbi:rhophilin-1-like isoform X2 [Paramormyrops kingsleyae]